MPKPSEEQQTQYRIAEKERLEEEAAFLEEREQNAKQQELWERQTYSNEFGEAQYLLGSYGNTRARAMGTLDTSGLTSGNMPLHVAESGKFVEKAPDYTDAGGFLDTSRSDLGFNDNVTHGMTNREVIELLYKNGRISVLQYNQAMKGGKDFMDSKMFSAGSHNGIAHSKDYMISRIDPHASLDQRGALTAIHNAIWDQTWGGSAQGTVDPSDTTTPDPETFNIDDFDFDPDNIGAFTGLTI